MEFYYESIKFLIFIETNMVIINAIDYKTLCDYTVELMATDFPSFKTAERLHTALVDGFGKAVPECKLDIHVDKFVNNIVLRLSIASYLFNVETEIVLKPLKEIKEIKLLTNKIDYFNEKLNEKDREIKELRKLLDEVRIFLPSIKLWSKMVPAAENDSNLARWPNGLPFNLLTPKISQYQCNNIMIQGNVLTVGGSFVAYLNTYKNFPIIELLSRYDPKRLTISGKSSMDGIIIEWLETEVSYNSLSELVLDNQSIKTISRICKLKLKKLTLKSCKNIRDLQLLIKMDTLEILEVTADINTGVFANGVHFVINII